jgi:hypothetical protein
MWVLQCELHDLALQPADWMLLEKLESMLEVSFTWFLLNLYVTNLMCCFWDFYTGDTSDVIFYNTNSSLDPPDVRTYGLASQANRWYQSASTPTCCCNCRYAEVTPIPCQGLRLSVQCHCNKYISFHNFCSSSDRIFSSVASISWDFMVLSGWHNWRTCKEGHRPAGAHIQKLPGRRAHTQASHA